MRYLGNKSKLLSFIENVMSKYHIEGEVFADLFSGTSSVGDYFKDRFKIISNDYMHFASVIAKAKLLNASAPQFEKFILKYGVGPFEWLNSQTYCYKPEYFLTNNYTPRAGRMFFTEENALKIDGMRLSIEELYRNSDIKENEYYFLLASLLESVLKVSNTSGTYQAYFKFWENRAIKQFTITPLEMNEVDHIFQNQFYCSDTNLLCRRIEGDIAYIDTPYTTNQYTNSYHVLETITRYDYPEIFGKTGRRKKRELSLYSNKCEVYQAFEDLLRQLQFKHVLISYSNQGLIPIDELVELAKLFAVNGEVHIEKNEYREYATNNLSYKHSDGDLKECIIYFQKDLSINKSPLNYSGSKDGVLSSIIKCLPAHVPCFVDAMGGAFNVGANIFVTENVEYYEYNSYIYDLVKLIIYSDPDCFIEQIEKVVDKYKLKKGSRAEYLKLRADYNESKDCLLLYVLHIYAFQNMIRFNSKLEMNTPVGNNEFNEGFVKRIHDFHVRAPKFSMYNCRYQDIDLSKYPKETVFYFDPPYFITKAEYNDGKRGLEGWNADKETELLSFLKKLDDEGFKFMLSNVLQHNGKEHHVLIEWIKQHKYYINEIGATGIKYPRREVLITNYLV